MPSAPHPAWVHPIPNALTFGRLALAVALPFAPPSLRIATVLLAALTDFLDGWIARRFHAGTALGRLLDGVADKAFAASVVVTLTLDGTMRPWQGPVVLARDLVVVALTPWVAVAHGPRGLRPMQVRHAGKLATLLAFVWCATLLLPAAPPVRDGAFVLAAAASLWAAGDYLVRAQQLRASSEEGRSSGPPPTLVPFDPAHAATVSSWARTDAEVRAWCARDLAPVPPEAIAAWGREEGVRAHALLEGGRPVAYGELWVDAEAGEVEVARLLVDPERRGLGLGRFLAARLAERARGIHPRVFLRVHPDNAIARRCYAAAGFERVPPQDEDLWNRGQPARYVWMAHR